MDEAKRILDAVDIEPYLAQWVNLSDLEEKLKEVTGNDDLFDEISLDEFYDYLIHRYKDWYFFEAVTTTYYVGGKKS